MADLEEKILETFEKKIMIWWRYIDDIFFIWEHDEESLKVFIDKWTCLILEFKKGDVASFSCHTIVTNKK